MTQPRPTETALHFYSQFGEDRILNAIFAGVSSGVCVEVGVNDPINFSNTYFFERLGWQTLLVEANPDTWETIGACRTGRLFRCAASDRPGKAPLLIAGKALGLSTLEFSRSDAIAKADGSVRMIEVPLRTLTSILEEADVTHVDFLSIDVEGHEASVLGGLDFRTFKPTVVLVERNRLRDKTVDSYLKARGYLRFLTTGCNEWYVRPEAKELIQRAKSAYTFSDSMVVFRERLRLVTIALLPGGFVRGIRRAKHLIARRSAETPKQ